MANFVALAAARNWWAERLGVDVGRRGWPGSPRAGHPLQRLHPPQRSAGDQDARLGPGQHPRLAADGGGRLDLATLERELDALGGAPAIIVANAGEVNAGDFDPIAPWPICGPAPRGMVPCGRRVRLFARLSQGTRQLAEGVESADSVIADGHKWLNVPYDCGFAFVRRTARLVRAFGVSAAYLPDEGDARPDFGYLAPENVPAGQVLCGVGDLAGLRSGGLPARWSSDTSPWPGHLAARVDEAARAGTTGRGSSSISSASAPIRPGGPRTATTPSTVTSARRS